eukprot:jgi/Galph1/2865/GphlegSOOS_G1506.1
MSTSVNKLLITGATGKTGFLAFKKAAELADTFVVHGLAKSKEKTASLFGSEDSVFIGSVLDEQLLNDALAGCQKLLILTSSVPVMKRNPDGSPVQPPQFEFVPGEEPEQVVWNGHKKQVDIAKKNGVDHIVFVSSMGVTRKDHPLNRLGNILIWKKKAEDYLISSGVPYTIIRPGGLVDEPGNRRELLIGHDDNLLDSEYRTIPREDVAEIAVYAFLYDEAKNKCFDIVSKSAVQDYAKRDWKTIFSNA